MYNDVKVDIDIVFVIKTPTSISPKPTSLSPYYRPLYSTLLLVV